MFAIEKIRAAAIRCTLTTNGEYIPIMVCGMNHAECFAVAHEMYGTDFFQRDKVYDIQGFVTTTGRFVNRREAMKIACNAGQLKFPNSTKYELDSYDINFALE